LPPLASAKFFQKFKQRCKPDEGTYHTTIRLKQSPSDNVVQTMRQLLHQSICTTIIQLLHQKFTSIPQFELDHTNNTMQQFTPNIASNTLAGISTKRKLLHD